MSEVLAVHVLDGDVRDVFPDAVVEDLNDMRTAEQAAAFGLPLEALANLGTVWPSRSMNLIAQSTSRLVCSASQTDPMPPRPSSRTSRKRSATLSPSISCTGGSSSEAHKKRKITDRSYHISRHPATIVRGSRAPFLFWRFSTRSSSYHIAYIGPPPSIVSVLVDEGPAAFMQVTWW